MPLWIREPLAILADAAGGLVVDQGRIVELVPAGGRPSTPDCQVFDARRHVVLPGLVNTHQPARTVHRCQSRVATTPRRLTGPRDIRRYVMESRVCVICDSRYGTTLELAKAVAAGAREEGADVRLRRVELSEPEYSVDAGRTDYLRAQVEYRALPRACADDLVWANGIVWGSPTRYGLMSTPLRAFIDEVAPLWRQGALIGKVGAAFTSTGGMHSGNEMTLLSLLLPFMQHGMLLAGVPHSVPALVRTRTGGSPYGASAVTGFNGTLGVDQDEREIAHALGARMARLAVQVRPEPASVELAAAAAADDGR